MKYPRLNFGFIVFLASVALIRPLFSVIGVYEKFDGAWPEATTTVLIMAVWVGLVVGRRTPNPIGTLALAGAIYGALSLVPRFVIGLFVSGPETVSVDGVVVLGILVANTLWGVLSGFVAKALLWTGR